MNLSGGLWVYVCTEQASDRETLEAIPLNSLVERMQTGDEGAFEEFFNAYKGPVYTTALAITRDRCAAEEILQDCFVRAYGVRARLRTDVSPLPFLLRIATNLCYSRIARKRHIIEPLTSIIANLVADLRARPEEIAESREVIEVLQRGIDALPPKQQTAIVLYYLHGYSLAEAADIAGCNVGTMKSRIHYALRALRTLLDGDRHEALRDARRLAADELP
jgi:RNA polymerase sigma-70 factor (ECF subfamily)